MAATTLARAGSGLIAVLLVTRSKPGPKLVFHYPQFPSSRSLHKRKHSIDSDESATDTDGEHDDDDGGRLAGQHGANDPSQHLLGHSIDSLEKLLSPGRWSNGKKFEICLDGLTFLGHPVYALEDGKWSEELSETAPTTREPKPAKPQYGEYHMYLDPGSVASSPPNATEHDYMHMPDSLESHVLGTSLESTSTSSGRGIEQIAMFHVVFVLNSKGRRGQQEVSVVYEDVVKKLSMALHYLQKQSNFVAAESRRMLSLRAKAKQQQEKDSLDMWKQVVETSELAWALKEIYEKIYLGEIADVRLNGMEMSLFVHDVRHDEAASMEFTPLSAVLLLEPKEELLHQLSHPEASPMAHFIREHTPTKSLLKHAINLGISMNDIFYFVRHLIRWRKAQIIAPLHQRNTYVVGPDAPLGRLPTLIEKYSKAFPTLPALPNMLKVLSGKPIKFGLLIPSRDHRGAYMDILGFLVRHNLVVLLKTSGWLNIPKSLLKASPVDEVDRNRTPMSVRALLSPHLRPVDDDEVSVSSERTAIPAALNKAVRSKRLSTGTQVSLNSSAHSHSRSQEKILAEDERVLIVNPDVPTAEETNLIAALTRSLTDREMKEHCPSLVKFFDGETAYEQIAANLGLKRAKVEEWIDELEGRGMLLSMRYI